jgi:hypothetical protein
MGLEDGFLTIQQIARHLMPLEQSEICCLHH